MITDKEEFLELLKNKIEENKIKRNDSDKPFMLDRYNRIRTVHNECPITYLVGEPSENWKGVSDKLDILTMLSYIIVDAADNNKLGLFSPILREELLKLVQ